MNIFRINDIIITLQPLMLTGKSGAIGPNAQHLVARGPNSGPELAVNQPLGATKPVLAITQRLNIA